jgi:hypothetical protein
MSNDFVDYINHLNVIEEAISPENYRDNQIGKIFDDGTVIFVNNFLDKVIGFFGAIPSDMEYVSVGPRGSDPRGGISSTKKDLDYVKRKNYKDEFAKETDKFTSKALIHPSEHNYNYVSDDKAREYNNIKKSIENIKNKNCKKHDISIFIKDASKEFIDKINNNTLSVDEEHLLNKSIYDFISKDKLTSSLVETRGKNKNIWLVSPIKDAIYNTNLKDQISKNPQVKQKILSEIQSDIDKKEKELSSIKNLNTKTNIEKSEKITEQISDLKKELDDLKASQHINFLTVKESLKNVVSLFKNIKQKINKNSTNEFDRNISWRKLIFDYNDLTSSGLSNQIVQQKKYVIDFLINLDFKVNEIEFDLGYVTPPEDYTYSGGQDVGSPISFSDLIIYLKVKSNEIKPKDENKLKKLLDELNLKKDVDYKEIVDLKLLISNRLNANNLEGLKNLDVVKSFNDDTLKDMDNKALLDWAAKNGKSKEMQTVIKRYDKNKYSQLLTMVKIFLNKSKEEYLKTIELLDNPKLTTSSSKYKIIFTLSPRIFISQSTRANLKNGITSCMNIFFGCNRRYVPTGLASGAFTAYLVKVNKNNDMSGSDVVDSKIINPIARVVIKPFKKENSNDIYWYVDRPYVDRANRIDDFDVKVKTILNKYHNANIGEGKYSIARGNYVDSVGTFNVDRLFKIINSEELLEKLKKDLENNSKEAMDDFDKVIDKVGDNIFNIWGKSKFHPTPRRAITISRDIRKLPEGINCSSLTVKNRTLSKLPDDLLCKKLTLDKDHDNNGNLVSSKVTTLNNLKHIDKIEELLIDNSSTPMPVSILNSKNLKFLRVRDNTINSNEINLENAKIEFFKRDIFTYPEKIVCDELVFENVRDFSMVKSITCNKLTIKKTLSLTKEEINTINNSKIKSIKIYCKSTRHQLSNLMLDLSNLTNSISIEIECNKNFNIKLPTIFQELQIIDTEATFINSSQLQKINIINLITMNINLPSSEDFWKNVYSFTVKDCDLDFYVEMLKCKAFLIDLVNNNVNLGNFRYLNNKKITRANVDALLENSNFKIIKELQLNEKIKKPSLENLQEDHVITKKLTIDIDNNGVNDLLKDKTVNVMNATIININISEDIKFNFNINFLDEPTTLNKNITINVDKKVKKIDISNLFKSNKSVITIISESDDDSIYDDISLKVIGSTNFIMKNKKITNSFIPISLNEIDKKHKLNVNNEVMIRFSLDDMKNKFAFGDYFNFKNDGNELTFDIYIYEVYHDLFKKINIPYDAMLDVASDEVKTQEHVDKVNLKIKELIDKINFEITDLEQINKKNKVLLDFKNITFSNEKFAKQNGLDLGKVEKIKKEIIQKHKINVFFIETLYAKLIEKIDVKYLANQARPKITASKNNSFLPEI